MTIPRKEAWLRGCYDLEDIGEGGRVRYLSHSLKSWLDCIPVEEELLMLLLRLFLSFLSRNGVMLRVVSPCHHTPPKKEKVISHSRNDAATVQLKYAQGIALTRAHSKECMLAKNKLSGVH